MRIVVTGTAGFIGSHVAPAAAAAGHEVLGLDCRVSAAGGFASRSCSLLDRAELTRVLSAFKPDAVLHLAARTDLGETRDIAGYAANTEGVSNLLAAIAAAGTVKRVICTSSQLVHPVGYRPQSDEEYAPATLYGRSKVETERLWRAADGGGTTWCIVRPTTIWGPRMNPHYVQWLALIRDGRYFHIGPRPTLKSYGFVGNTARQYLTILTAPTRTIHRRMFYLADYEPLALEDWGDAFARELGATRIKTIPLVAGRVMARGGDFLQMIGVKRVPLTSFRLNNIRTPYQVDLDNTRAVCGPLPYSVQDGVRITAEWVRQQWSASVARTA